jgi:hypothetical protein
VALDDLKGTAELVDDGALCLDAVQLLQPTSPVSTGTAAVGPS